MSSVATDAAADLAVANLVANCNALAKTQSQLATRSLALPANLGWLFARDGSLTAVLDGERWWAGCSVPRAAARFMLRTMDVRGTVGCFLHASHAAQLRVALDRLHSRQAILAIVPEAETFAVLLHVEDFSRDIAAGRLWFAAGAAWEEELEAIFDRNPGLPTPVEFVRPILADSSPADQLIEPAQTVFARVSSTRTGRVQSLLSEWRPGHTRRVCLLAGSEFRLWDSAGLALTELGIETAGIDVYRVDPDRPTSASPLALADAAVQCDAVLAANCFRQDLAGITPNEQPWVTWVTTSRIPPAQDAGPNDRLLISDPSFRAAAIRQGWDDHRIQLAGWPDAPIQAPANGEGYLAVIADTHPLDPPKQLSEYSSQLVLWDLIRDELARDPFLATGDMGQYLKSRRSRLQIGEPGFDAATFIDRLIVPAMHQGLASFLVRAGLPVRLFGQGWDQIDGLAEHHRGIVSSRAEVGRIIEQSAAAVHLWPWQSGHPIESIGRPVVRARSANEQLREARAACSGKLAIPARNAPPISGECVAHLLKRPA
ncbi:MAG TPA: hypothetical protein VGI81_16725 [Tepidisphaeraceae bacterium]|jgi:hypothetical protein